MAAAERSTITMAMIGWSRVRILVRAPNSEYRSALLDIRSSPPMLSLTTVLTTTRAAAVGLAPKLKQVAPVAAARPPNRIGILCPFARLYPASGR